MNDDPLLLVSAGMFKPKKADHALARLHMYLNYGLLGLASVLSERGYNVKLAHGRFSPPEDFVRHIIDKQWLRTNYPLFLSIPSSYAIGWSKEFCKLVREQRPDIKIIVGGRWVVGTDGRWIKSLIPQTDLVVYGTAERRVERLLDPGLWPGLSSTSAASSPTAEQPLERLPDLHYSLMDDFEEFQPSIEISRGCGMGCAFCVEKDVPMSKLESPATVIRRMVTACEEYGQNSIRPYFEASYFRPDNKWAREFEGLYRSAGLRVRWRCESRVDALSPGTLNLLAGAGLRVIDLGLESASFRQLVAMGKTTNPSAYLRRASNFLTECKKAGVWVKVNVLLYAGETYDSIQETVDWLGSHQACVKGVSVGPLVVYRFGAESKYYLNSLAALGALAVDPGSLEREGVAKLHLSREIDYEASEGIAIGIGQQFMSERDYFDLKGFSYLPRTFTYADFLHTLDAVNASNVPFKIRPRKDEAVA